MTARRLFPPLALAALLAAPAGEAAAEGQGPIRWQGYADDTFARARAEGRFVLLDLEAVWCHWCHVMDATTYRDPEVVRLVEARYLPVRVDQDSRPDLANRYEDYGWPATVVFAPDGSELAKLQGYIPPRRMAALLQAVIDDPTPGPSVTGPRERAAAAGLAPDGASGGGAAARAGLPQALRDEIARLFDERYDGERGGWGFTHKFLDWDSVEWALRRARAGDAAGERMARETLGLQRKLFDPVWGGVYQYSDSGDWEHPHFEKIMAMQAENLRIYAQAFALYGDPELRRAVAEIHRYLRAFLRGPEGAFYTSQDADVVRGEHAGGYFALADAERRARGVPRVDIHVYTRENAWAIHALAVAYGATGEPAYLDDARAAAAFLLRERALPGGGFRHDARDPAGPYLGDNVAAARAFLALHAVTAERDWLRRGEAALDFLAERFAAADGIGYLTSVAGGGLPGPLAQREENIAVARTANLLHHYTGQARHRRVAEQAMRHLSQPAVARRFNAGGVLLADAELAAAPLHLTVVGRRDDPAAQALFRAANATADPYKRVELFDRREGPPANPDVEYPELRRAAAFLCADGRCSSPAFTPEELAVKLARLAGGGRTALAEPSGDGPRQ